MSSPSTNFDGDKVSNETRPLLTSLDKQQQQRGKWQVYNANQFSLPPHTGRGKIRFDKRQQMRMMRRSRSFSNSRYKCGVYNSLFSTRTLNFHSKPLSKLGLAAVPEQNHGARGITQQQSFELPHTNTKNRSSADQEPSKAKTQHSSLYDMLNSKSRTNSAAIFQKFITIVILLDCIVYVLSTEPKFSENSFFYVVEGVTSSIFLIEYVCRLSICIEAKKFAAYGPIRGRLKYMCTSRALIDAFATLPFFIELISGIPLPTFTYVRVFRLLRMTRTHSYSQAMDAVCRVLYFNREILHVAGLLGMYLVILTSVLMYYLRPRGKDVDYVDDPTDFDSIASTMVLSILMLTGQGGPSGNLPWYTQCVVLMTGIFSVAMFAIPASMLTWGFEAEAQRLAVKAKRKALAKRRGEAYYSSTSSSSSENSNISGYGDISTSDEEYMNIIGGEEDESDHPEEFTPTNDGEVLKSLQNRVDQLEQSIVTTNNKLDLILERLGVTTNG